MPVVACWRSGSKDCTEDCPGRNYCGLWEKIEQMQLLTV